MNANLAHSRRAGDRPARAAVVLATALALAGCGRGPALDHTRSEDAAPVAVQVIAPPPAETGALVLPARVKARAEAVVSARAAGRVTAILVREGESVRAGQPLARFDAPESRQALAAAERDAAAADRALDVARRQGARMDSLFAQGIVATRDRELADSDRAAAEARAQAAQAALAEARTAVAPPAPFAGVVVRRHVDAGADVAAGAPLFDVRSGGAIELIVPVPEAALPALTGARWQAEDATGAWRDLALASLDGMTDPSTRTRTAHLVPARAPAAAFEPGAFARVRLSSARLAASAPPGGEPVRLLPRSALVRRGGLAGAFVIKDGRAELRWLKLGRDDADPVEVLAGLFPGEAVAKDPRGLHDGAPVRVAP